MPVVASRLSAPERDSSLDNAAVAELFARDAEHASGHLKQAFRRASRKALLWPDEVSDLVLARRSLTELDGIGPTLARRLHQWMEEVPAVVEPPQIRSEFLTFAHTRKILAQHTKWSAMLRGDLHMHTLWSDGSSTVAEMARAAEKRGYRFIAITDHTKGLKVANGLNEQRLLEQRNEIDATNAALASTEPRLRNCQDLLTDPFRSFLENSDHFLGISGRINLQKSGGNVIDHKNHLVTLSVVRHLLNMIAKDSAHEVTTEDRLWGSICRRRGRSRHALDLRSV